ncbi:hypothetical protein KEM52_006645 [Ascosphaera acerosa]|nr:hypothetical protein KEM52_006645 [Ascosphaera acerosa]
MVKGKKYAELISRIQNETEPGKYGDGYEFLEDYAYSLKTDILVDLGRQQLYESGISFYDRYQGLAERDIPFVRASVSPRVVESAEHFLQGYNVKSKIGGGKPAKTTVDVVMYEDPGMNTTLELGSCPAFEKHPDQQTWIEPYEAQHFNGTLERLRSNLPGAQLQLADVVSLMELCALVTVSESDGKTLAPFCALFTDQEWKAYDYLFTLQKYYEYGAGNSLASSNGVGWVNEMIARLTNQSLKDETNTNHTLDDDPRTFPLGRPLYADFSHDNIMMTIYAALGVTGPALSTDRVESPAAIDYYTTSRLVPFAGRLIVEKLRCDCDDKEYVRVLLNDRIVATNGCAVDYLGRCELSAFLRGLDWARTGGNWSECYQGDLSGPDDSSYW